jgi:hypothetical protein
LNQDGKLLPLSLFSSLPSFTAKEEGRKEGRRERKRELKMIQ